MLDKRWETEPCKCNIDVNTGKLLPFRDECKSLIIPAVSYSPLDSDLAKRIVDDHNTMLDIKEIHKLMPKSPFEGFGLNL